MKKQLIMAMSVALGLAAPLVGNASTTINIDTTGGSGPVLSVGSLDWSVGNALSVANPGDNIAGTNVAPGKSFFTYAHGTLGNFQDSSGNAITSNGGLNSSYNWTFVAGFEEQYGAGSVAGNTNFSVVNNAKNFFQIYYDPNRDANMLAGTGFNNGTLVLEARGTAAGASGIGNFTAVPGQTANLDSFGTNQYPDIQSVVGTGGTLIDATVTSVNSNFILSSLNNIILNLSFNTSNKLPFDETNPSSCFWDANTSSYVMGAGNGYGGCGTNSTGTVGSLNGVTGPNVMFQADANNSFNTTIPEPASLALVGMGLAAMGATISRRRKRGLKA